MSAASQLRDPGVDLLQRVVEPARRQVAVVAVEGGELRGRAAPGRGRGQARPRGCGRTPPGARGRPAPPRSRARRRSPRSRLGIRGRRAGARLGRGLEVEGARWASVSAKRAAQISASGSPARFERVDRGPALLDRERRSRPAHRQAPGEQAQQRALANLRRAAGRASRRPSRAPCPRGRPRGRRSHRRPVEGAGREPVLDRLRGPARGRERAHAACGWRSGDLARCSRSAVSRPRRNSRSSG